MGKEQIKEWIKLWEAIPEDRVTEAKRTFHERRQQLEQEDKYKHVRGPMTATIKVTKDVGIEHITPTLWTFARGNWEMSSTISWRDFTPVLKEQVLRCNTRVSTIRHHNKKSQNDRRSKEFSFSAHLNMFIYVEV